MIVSDRPKVAKCAVVVIHGIGNQSPMATLRGFVEAVWTSCKTLAKDMKPLTWTKPDVMSGNYELRRVTTNFDVKDKRLDFFEFYWADQMEDTTLVDVPWWLKRLLWRPASRVPPAVIQLWMLGRVLAFVVVLVLAGFGWGEIGVLHAAVFSVANAFLILMVLSVAAAIIWYVRHVVLVQIVGDAARYLTPAPSNIAARSRIRTLGLHLLQELHENDDYDRIILACHSLGTVIGYDVLTFYWSTVNSHVHHSPGDPALADITKTIAALRTDPSHPQRLMDFRNAQREYARAIGPLSADPERWKGWKVTDFVTLGSPLTHAPVLLVDDREDLLKSDVEALNVPPLDAQRTRLAPPDDDVAKLLFARMAQREFPACPPLPDDAGSTSGFAYAVPGTDYESPHHAAVFGPVRWTNIYAPSHDVVWGDVIGGPVARLFGPGVKDIALTREVGTMRAAHTHYWDLSYGDNAEHLCVLRSALNLLDEPE